MDSESHRFKVHNLLWCRFIAGRNTLLGQHILYLLWNIWTILSLLCCYLNVSISCIHEYIPLTEHGTLNIIYGRKRVVGPWRLSQDVSSASFYLRCQNLPEKLPASRTLGCSFAAWWSSSLEPCLHGHRTNNVFTQTWTIRVTKLRWGVTRQSYRR